MGNDEHSQMERAMNKRWYVPKTGWDYFIVLGVLINVVVSILLMTAYFLR